MLKAYKPSVSYLEEHKAALSSDHRTVTNATRTEILHLTKFFRSEELPIDAGRQATPELIKHIRADGSSTSCFAAISCSGIVVIFVHGADRF